MDATDQTSVTSAFHQAMDIVGPPTLLVTCAGSIDPLGPIGTSNPNDWWHAVTVHVLGTMLCVHAAVPHMLERGAGRIVTIYGNLWTSPR
jgi:NADP-dependent 3-hydroxy acid dehydrogenase YdfG